MKINSEYACVTSNVLPLGYPRARHFNQFAAIKWAVSLTFHINRDVSRWPLPQLVLSCTGIISRVRGLDGAEDKLWVFTGRFEVYILLVPGVYSCWVSITATGQSHWTALHYLTRETHWHWGKLWTICRTICIRHNSLNKKHVSTRGTSAARGGCGNCFLFWCPC